MTPIPTFPPPAAMETSPQEDSSFKYKLPLLQVVPARTRFCVFDWSSREEEDEEDEEEEDDEEDAGEEEW